jgi:hypothetical protein
MANLIAISSYGSHRVKHPHTSQMVSAYKMGYSSAASAVLLALYGDRAQDVSSKQASYHYIQIDADVTVRHGHILLKVTAAELARVETLTRQVHRPAVYRWQEGAWFEFPSLRQPDYTAIAGRSGPTFNPTGMPIVSAATGEAEAAIAGIIVAKSQRSEHDIPWYWIRGDTYPHRDLLKRWGCRWSKKRKAWYYTGWTLPDAVQQLLDRQNAGVPNGYTVVPAPDADSDPCPVEAAAILGMRVKDDGSQDGPPRRFQLGTAVYTRHDLETADGEPVSGIRVTRGSVASPDLAIKQALLESGQQPEAIVDAGTDAEGVEQASNEPGAAPKVRVIKPALDVPDGDEPDAVIAAIRQTSVEPLPVVPPSTRDVSGRRTLARIPQQPCGELTGSISGSVWCYGYAVHDGVCVYVNMGGPRTAVEAIRAKLAKGDVVNCVPWDAPAVELTAGEGNTGKYQDFMQHIPEAKFTSLILCHELLTQPNYGGKSTTFIFHISDEQAMAQLRHHVTKLVNVPVFAAWTGYLWQTGQSAMLLRPTRSGGDVRLCTLTLDADTWTRLITGGLAQGLITLPPLQYNQPQIEMTRG